MSFLLLVAQAGGPLTDSRDMPLGIMIVLLTVAVMTVPIVAIITGIKFATKQRELEHAERMQALEKGLLLDDVDEERRFRKGIIRLATGIGVVVPICAVGGATGAVTSMGANTPGSTIFLIWTGAAAVGVAGAASGAWLAQAAILRLRPSSRPRAPEAVFSRGFEATEAAAVR